MPKKRANRKPKTPMRILEGVKLVCPATGMRYIDRETNKLREVRFHYCVVRLCRNNGGVFYVCQSHGVRGFLSGYELMKEIRRSEGIDATPPAQQTSVTA